MKLYNPTLIKTGSQEQIQYWESPEPNVNDYTYQLAYDMDYDKWLASKKTLDVHPSAVEELMIFAFKEVTKDMISIAGDGGTRYKIKNGGISLSGIEDRLAFKVDCLKVCDGECIDCEHMEKYFFLKPLPSKEEETQ